MIYIHSREGRAGTIDQLIGIEKPRETDRWIDGCNEQAGGM